MTELDCSQESESSQRRERERNWTPGDYRDDGFCTSCGAFLPNEYHEDDCLYVEQRRVDELVDQAVKAAAEDADNLIGGPVAHRRGWFEARAYANLLTAETGREHVVERDESNGLWGVWEVL